MNGSRVGFWFRFGVWLVGAGAACGGRSELLPGNVQSGGGGSGTGGMAQVECSADADCGGSDACTSFRCRAGVCFAVPTSCDDDDVCTEDSCDPFLGCAHRPLTQDSDGDGFPGPRAGVAPGVPGSCGSDCNDRSAAAFPGNVEICDGVDNDCNGVIDDNTAYVAAQTTPIRVSSLLENKRAQRGGFAATRDGFALTYEKVQPLPGGQERTRALLKGLTAQGETLFENDVSEVNAETYPGPLAWSGEVLASAWSDNRQDRNYEIYLGRFDALGQKLGPNQRVTDAPNFSKNASIQWNQSEFLLAWDDRRREGSVGGDRTDIFVQRVAADGTLLGANTPLVADAAVNENPVLAMAAERIGIVYTVTSPTGVGGARAGFRVLDAATLAVVGAQPEPIGVDVETPTVYFVGDRFIVLWAIYPSEGSPSDAIWGAAFGLDGQLLLPPRPVTSGARFARYQEALSLGDRLLLMWSDDHDDPNGTYEIYWEILGPDLSVREPRQRLTFNSSNSYGAALAIGAGGKIAVVFNDFQDGSRQVYFTTLECGPRRR